MKRTDWVEQLRGLWKYCFYVKCEWPGQRCILCEVWECWQIVKLYCIHVSGQYAVQYIWWVESPSECKLIYACILYRIQYSFWNCIIMNFLLYKSDSHPRKTSIQETLKVLITLLMFVDNEISAEHNSQRYTQVPVERWSSHRECNSWVLMQCLDFNHFGTRGL